MELKADIGNGHDLILHCISEYYTGIVLVLLSCKYPPNHA